MKKIIICICLFIVSTFAEQIDHLYFGVESNCDQVLIKKAYVSCINYKTKNPEWVTYTITKELAEKYNSRKDNNFKEDKEIPDNYRSTLEDYYKSGYDRGHLMPNAMADYTEETQEESFLLSNIVPQLPNHNRTIWKKLEEQVRELIKTENELVIFTGVIYDKNYNTIGNNVAIPSYFYKVILSPINKTIKTFAFLIPHQNYKKGFNLKDFQTTVDEIEYKTGINFFSNLEEEQQQNIESKIFNF